MPTGGSPDVVHFLKYAMHFKVFGELLSVLEGVPPEFSFIIVMLLGSLQ